MARRVSPRFQSQHPGFGPADLQTHDFALFVRGWVPPLTPHLGGYRILSEDAFHRFLAYYGSDPAEWENPAGGYDVQAELRRIAHRMCDGELDADWARSGSGGAWARLAQRSNEFWIFGDLARQWGEARGLAFPYEEVDV